MQLLRGFLATNIPFNAITNLQLRATWTILRPSISIPAPTTLRRRLGTYYNAVVDEIKTLFPRTGRVSIISTNFVTLRLKISRFRLRSTNGLHRIVWPLWLLWGIS